VSVVRRAERVQCPYCKALPVHLGTQGTRRPGGGKLITRRYACRSCGASCRSVETRRGPALSDFNDRWEPREAAGK
jgi:C4-type Zn-finger protein